MSLIDQVVTRIDTAATTFVTVKHSWTTKPIEDFDAELPAALPYLDGDTSEPSPYSNETIQPGEVVVSVMLVCEVADLEDLRNELYAALGGWQPTGNKWDVFEHVSGDNQAILGGICWWVERYAITRYSGG